MCFRAEDCFVSLRAGKDGLSVRWSRSLHWDCTDPTPPIPPSPVFPALVTKLNNQDSSWSRTGTGRLSTFRKSHKEVEDQTIYSLTPSRHWYPAHLPPNCEASRRGVTHSSWHTQPTNHRVSRTTYLRSKVTSHMYFRSERSSSS